MNIQQYRDLFEHQKTGGRSFWSFKLDKISDDNSLYNKLSAVINNSSLDQESKYQFTVEALDAMIELQDSKVNLDEPSGYLDGEVFDGYAEAPIYNSELLEWLAAGNVAAIDEAIDSFGWEGVGKSILTAIQIGYSEAWKAHYFEVLEAIKE